MDKVVFRIKPLSTELRIANCENCDVELKFSGASLLVFHYKYSCPVCKKEYDVEGVYPKIVHIDDEGKVYE